MSNRQLIISPPGLGRALLILVAVVSALGLVAEIAYDLNGRNDFWDLRHFTSLSHEENLPTWVASGLLLGCAVLLVLIGRDSGVYGRMNSTRIEPDSGGYGRMNSTLQGGVNGGAGFTRHWYGLAAIFAYISLDETSQIHENWNWIDSDIGVFYFSWVIPAAIITTVIGLIYLRFLLNLPDPTRRRVLLAAVLYVGGALGMELPLSYWTDRAGDSNLVYGLIDWLEETLELAGTALFLYALLLHWLQTPVSLQLNEAPGGRNGDPGAS